VAEDNGRSLAAVITELKEELKAFVQVRVSLMMSEMRDKAAAVKTTLPMLIIGAVLLWTAWLLLSMALVAAVVVAFQGNPFAWAFALLIVGGAYAIMGGIGLLFAYRGLTDMGILPRRTIKVLEADRAWLNQEARSGI
jgi:uncharacterized membrane protein YqjE